MTICKTWHPPKEEGQGFYHHVHRPAKNRNGKRVLQKKMCGAKPLHKIKLEEIEDEEVKAELRKLTFQNL